MYIEDWHRCINLGRQSIMFIGGARGDKKICKKKQHKGRNEDSINIKAKGC